MFSCYILYGAQLDRYYIGSSENVTQRLERHQTHYYPGQHYTDGAEDWEVYHLIECDSKEQARKIERHIKRMKSRKYLHQAHRES